MITQADIDQARAQLRAVHATMGDLGDNWDTQATATYIMSVSLLASATMLRRATTLTKVQIVALADHLDFLAAELAADLP